MKEILLKDLKEISESNIPFEEFRNASFFITGATGLVGSLLVKTLLFINREKNLNIKVYALARNIEKAKALFSDYTDDETLSFVIADLEKDELSIEGECDYIVHAAAITTSKTMVSNPVETIMTSVEGTNKVLRLASEKKTKNVVYISSMEAYGQPSTQGLTHEADLGYVDITKVRSCYPEGKRICECLCTAYASQYDMDICVARLAQTFGAGTLPGENRVFAQFARSAMEGNDIILHTTGESEGNYVYTADAVKAILLLLLKGERAKSYNVVNENTHTTIRAMAEMVADRIAAGSIKVVIDIPEDAAKLGYAPPVKMKLSGERLRELGWTPTVDLPEAYTRLIEWMK
ncbi:MAG: NAD-dependent epimerase/dehydratase family protein [Clostridiales bacterium]|nr:NAD-dependent epimerase/dehydratase family protein [Clostridiales bacterium]